MFGELSLAFGVVLTSFFFSSSTEKKNKGLSFLHRPRCLLFGAAHGASDAGQSGWSFFAQSSSPFLISCPLSFILPGPNPWQVQRCALNSVVEQGADGSAAQCCLGTVRWACFPAEVATKPFRVMFYFLNTEKTDF